MRYSLHSRFRGVLIGAVVGEMLGKSSSIKRDKIYLKTAQAHPPIQLAKLLAQSLLRRGRFDLDDWREILYKNPSFRLLPGTGEEQIDNYYVYVSIIATLPIILFYHENEIKLRQNLQLALLEVGQNDSLNRDGVLAVGYVIAQSLKEQLHATDLIAQTIDFLGEPKSQLTDQLAQVQSLLEQGASLDKVITQLSAADECGSPIALAFYYCLSTLEDFRLSVTRAAQTSEQPEISSVITGALSGAYNSLSGIPATLRLALSRHHTSHLTAWGVTIETEMLQLADSLVAVWSGVYEQTGEQTELISVAAIAAPAIIRLR